MSNEDIIISPIGHLDHPNITFELPIVPNAPTMEEINAPTSRVEDRLDPVENIATQSSHRSTAAHFKPFNNAGKGPVANYYAEINWANGFEQWPLVRFSTPMDGSCLFHAISNSFFAPYHTETLNGKSVTRAKMVAALRKELSATLASKISKEDMSSLTHYETINGGNTSAFAEAVPEFALKYMQDQLDSHMSIGYGYIEFIGNALNKDIYILEALRHDIYSTNDLQYTIKGNRCSIVLYYMNGHYELVGIRNSDASYDTHFSPNHSFIQFLYNRVCYIRNRQTA